MDILDIIRDWGAHILSLLGILGGLWAYFNHDRKLKNQEKRLNDFQIKQFEKVEAKEKMAEIKCNTIKNSKGSTNYVRFVNIGASEARNVRVEIQNPPDEMNLVIMQDNWGPYSRISPQYYREEHILLCEGHPDVIDVKITWDDDFQKNRVVEISVPI